MERPRRVKKPRRLDLDCEENEPVTRPRVRRRRCPQCSCPAAPSTTTTASTTTSNGACAACRLKRSLERVRQRGQPEPCGPASERHEADEQQWRRDRLQAEFDQFSALLRRHLADPQAGHIFCPVIRRQPCACIQRHVLGNEEGSQNLTACLERAKTLLDLRKRAEQLKKLKYLDTVDEVTGVVRPVTGPRRQPGLGGGRRRNAAFERLVLQERPRLRQELGLCETATQRLLLYSNCFLHRRLRTDPDRQNRMQRANEIRNKIRLKPLSELSDEVCCSRGCVKLAETYPALVTRWRDEALKGQRAARLVLAQMLTPCADAVRNCLTFVCLVTGCSRSTARSVLLQLEMSGGDGSPPEHGLIRYWARRKAVKGLQSGSCKATGSTTVPGPATASATVPGPATAPATVPGPATAPATVRGPTVAPATVPGPATPPATVPGPAVAPATVRCPATATVPGPVTAPATVLGPAAAPATVPVVTSITASASTDGSTPTEARIESSGHVLNRAPVPGPALTPVLAPISERSLAPATGAVQAPAVGTVTATSPARATVHTPALAPGPAHAPTWAPAPVLAPARVPTLVPAPASAAVVRWAPSSKTAGPVPKLGSIRRTAARAPSPDQLRTPGSSLRTAARVPSPYQLPVPGSNRRTAARAPSPDQLRTPGSSLRTAARVPSLDQLRTLGSSLRTAAPASSPDQLRTLVQRQSAEIARLRRRLASQQRLIGQQRSRLDSLAARPTL